MIGGCPDEHFTIENGQCGPRRMRVRAESTSISLPSLTSSPYSKFPCLSLTLKEDS